LSRFSFLFWIALAAVVIAVVVWTVYPVYLEKARLERKLANLNEARRKQEMIYLNLRKDEALLEQNDPVYLEKLVRDTFGWCREGEIIYKFDERGENKR